MTETKFDISITCEKCRCSGLIESVESTEFSSSLQQFSQGVECGFRFIINSQDRFCRPLLATDIDYYRVIEVQTPSYQPNAVFQSGNRIRHVPLVEHVFFDFSAVQCIRGPNTNRCSSSRASTFENAPSRQQNVVWSVVKMHTFEAWMVIARFEFRIW